MKGANSSVTLFSAGELRLEKGQELQSLLLSELRVPATEPFIHFLSLVSTLHPWHISLSWSTKHAIIITIINLIV